MAEILGRRVELAAPASCNSQAEFIACFEPQIAALQTESDLERGVIELAEDAAAENIDYLEVRWAPLLHLRLGLTPRAVIEAVLRGLAAAPIKAVAIVCAMRHQRVHDNVELARLAGSYAGRGVVGFDLAGDEARYPAGPHRPAFEAARAAGLRLTCHAGETGEPASVAEALGLGVERIAHGVIAARSPAIVDRIRAEGVVLDVAPTANWKCRAVPSLAEHPLPRLVRSGVRCTISTDSRSVAAATLAGEFEICATQMGMSDDELMRCNITAYDAAFSR